MSGSPSLVDTLAETRGATYRAFMADLYRVNGWRLPTLIGLMSIVAFTDGLAVTLLLPLLTRVGIAGSKSTAAIAINNLLAAITPPDSGVGAILVVILFVAACQMVLSIAQGWWSAELIHRYALGWQMRLFGAFLKADWLFVTGRKGGDLSSATIVETGRIGGAFYYFTLLASTVVACLIYLLLAFFITWRATLLLIGLTFVMMLSISRLYRVSHAAGNQTGPLNAELQVLVSESLSGAKIIKATVSEQAMMARLEKVSHALNRLGRTRLFLPSLVRGVFEFMAFSALAIFFAFGMIPLHVAPADILIILALFMRLLPKFTTAQTLLHDLNNHVPAILILRCIAAEAESRAERTEGVESGLPITLPTRLEVRGLHAAYGDNAVLNGLSLALDVPGMVGIVGGSGAGKSTLVHVLLGLVNPSAGAITLGSRDMSDVALTAWRCAIGYVPQETMFFHASVAENLALARPDATREEIISAARLANAHDFIMALSEGYDTPIGDQGVLLSGGQRQRLGIARALVSRPVLLLLDEPTSALDPQSENEILATLDELRKTVGIVIVAHRLTTVQAADRIYVLDSGQVVESGSWSELIAHQDRFHTLAKLQQIVA